MSNYLSPSQMVEKAEATSDKRVRQIAIINAIFRAQDDSSLWPINGRFNATERGIRKVRKLMRETGETDVFSYALALEEEITRIVNNAI